MEKTKQIEQFKKGINWLTKERNRLAQMTDHWGQDERGCRDAWTFYLDKRNRFLEGIARDFDLLAEGFTDQQRLDTLSYLKVRD